MCTVTINVIRNPSSPIFIGNYETTINENYPVGDVILTVTARDADLDTVTYRIVAQDANNYFYIAPESGGIYLRRSIVLSNSINNRYVMTVQASDNRLQPRLTNATVIINVVRGQPPFFLNTPYSTAVNERVAIGTSVYRVSAQDNDLIGNIQYNLIGDIPGSSYFRVNSTTGMVFVAVNLRQDSTQFYQYG